MAFWFGKRFWRRLVRLPVPYCLTYFWSVGSALGLVLLIQIVTGFALAIHYNPRDAFARVDYIMRDVNEDWLFRLVHFGGASLFFVLIVVHIMKGLRTGGYHIVTVWLRGVFLLFLLMSIRFLGYSLEGSQIRY